MNGGKDHALRLRQRHRQIWFPRSRIKGHYCQRMDLDMKLYGQNPSVFPPDHLHLPSAEGASYSVFYPLSLAPCSSCLSAYCIPLPVQSLPSAQLQRRVDIRTSYTHPTDTDTTEKSGIKKGPPPHSPALPRPLRRENKEETDKQEGGQKGGV